MESCTPSSRRQEGTNPHCLSLMATPVAGNTPEQWQSVAFCTAGALPAELLPVQPDVWRMHPVRRQQAVLCCLPPHLRC